MNPMIGVHVKRNRIVRGLVKGKKVLDLGSESHGTDHELWNLINANAKTLVGLDLLPSADARILRGDAQNFDLREEHGLFDVIVVGELIEHLENPYEMLQCCKKHLKINGLLVLTTPNALSPFYAVKYGLLAGLPNPEHTHWYCKYTLKEMLSRCRLRVIRVEHYSRHTKKVANKVFHWLARRWPSLHLHVLMVCEMGDVK